MGNVVTCSLVDVAGTVTVTQTDGQLLEFMQPVFASQVRKLHPGNWLVHYASVHDSKSGKQHGKMSMLQGHEELETGQIYFLLPIPSHFRKRVLGPHISRRNSSSSSVKPSSSCSGVSTAVTSPQPLQPAAKPSSSSPSPSRSTRTSAGSSASLGVSSAPLYYAGDVKALKQSVKLEWSKSRSLRQQEPSPVFSMSGSPVSQTPCAYGQQPRSSKKSRCSNRQKIQLLDWRPTLVPIQEVF